MTMSILVDLVNRGTFFHMLPLHQVKRALKARPDNGRSNEEAQMKIEEAHMPSNIAQAQEQETHTPSNTSAAPRGERQLICAQSKCVCKCVCVRVHARVMQQTAHKR